MKLLVTGHKGQIAQSLVEAASRRSSLNLVALGRPELDFERAASIEACVAAIRPDVVINAAAYTAVDLAEDEPERAFAVNGAAPGVLARSCRASGARLIHISTDYVFDGTDEGPYAPAAKPHPIGVYGRSKLQGEEEVRAGTSDHLILRTAWVYSPFGKNFVKTMMHLPERQPVARVVSDQRGNPSSALDLAEGLLRIVDAWQTGEQTGLGSTYHLAGTGIASWARFAEEIFDGCRRRLLPACTVEPIATADWPTRAQRPMNSALDSSRFEADFQFRMPRWQDGLEVVMDRLVA